MTLKFAKREDSYDSIVVELEIVRKWKTKGENSHKKSEEGEKKE